MASLKKQIQFVEDNTEYKIERWERTNLNGHKAVSIEYSSPYSINTRFASKCVLFEDEIQEWFINLAESDSKE